MSDIAAPKLVRAPALRRVFDGTPWRRAVILAGFALIWELYARWLDNAVAADHGRDVVGAVGGDRFR